MAEICVNIFFSDRFVDLIDDDTDPTSRLGGSDDSRLMTRLLAPYRLVTCASQDDVKTQGVSTDIEELAPQVLAFVRGRPSRLAFQRCRPHSHRRRLAVIMHRMLAGTPFVNHPAA
jgi:hypothetical protein